MKLAPYGARRARRAAQFAQIATGLLAMSTAPAFAEESNDAGTRARGSAGSTPSEMSVQYVEGSEAPALEPEAPPPPIIGDQVAEFALQFVGYPYVWAGNTPAGFDCSGFTQYVILNMIGIDIGHAIEGQPAGGAWVDYGAWLPGDVVFFQNTYRAGISHAGIYIGDGLFIHAENEGTGVVISSISSDYYGPRYWGAIRVA
jgi:cell wall-associated NlpC family hydrolase